MKVCIGAVVVLALSACATTPNRAYWPDAWSAEEVETLLVSDLAPWYATDSGVAIGPYQAEKVNPSWWDSVATETGVSIGWGSGSSGFGIGVKTIHNESPIDYRMLAQGADIAAIHCDQYLHIENWQGGAGGRSWGEIIVQGNLSYQANLNCQALGFHPDWPKWQLDLRAQDYRPFFGILRVADESWSVAGTQEAAYGEYEASTGFEIRRGNEILARVNRIDQRDVVFNKALSAPERMALLAASAALLMATDPLAH